MTQTKTSRMTRADYIAVLRQELAPATGCTEPVAIAYAVAKAASFLSGPVESIQVSVSRNMMKNAMGVGIPGAGASGIDLAAALGAFGGDADAVLEVLHNITPQNVEQAQEFRQHHVTIALKDTPERLYIEATVRSGKDAVTVVIQGNHTNIVKITKNGETLFQGCDAAAKPAGAARVADLTVEGICRFVSAVNAEELSFLRETVELNRRIAAEGVAHNYGLRVGKTAYEAVAHSGSFDDGCDYAAALAAAAADARMSGCQMPVATLCGSGNQGITATVPVIATCDYFQFSEEACLRALALSCLITIHVKSFIGRLSPICGCGMGSSIGVCAAVTYLFGGGPEQIGDAIRNVIADVSGIICDGAKAGCALKVATVVNSAFRSARLALHGLGAGSLDGIVSEEVETSIRNIGRLGNEGMADADRVILDIMAGK